MPGIKKQLAKGNLIKSLAISGGITSVITAAGLGISIPVYRKIKNQLSEVSSQVADLSKFMSDLTAKLGIPANQTFEKELAGGYTLLYSNGKTMIFSGSGDQKSLVMNMNQDGTVGSAAKLEGPAAQQMLGIISEAKSTIGSEADAMEDIMQDFVDQTRDTSLANESTLTGATKALLIARNALSTNRKLTPKEKAELLKEAADASGVNLNDIKAAEQNAKELIKERNKRIKEEEVARKTGKNGLTQLWKTRAIAQKQEALDYLNNPDHDHPLSNVLFNGKTYSDISSVGNEEALSLYYQEMKIKDSQAKIADAKRIIATDWLDKQNIAYTNVTFKDVIGQGPNAQAKTYDNLADGKNDETLQNFYAYHVANLAKAKSEDQQIQKATTSGKGSSILQKVASSVTSWPSMYVKAKYGYTRPDGTAVSASSQLLNGLRNVLMQQGVTDQNYLQMISIFDQLLKVNTSNKPTKTFKLTTILNTYNESEATQARLLVLKADVASLNGASNLETKYIVARSSTRNIVDLESVSLLNSNQSKTIYYLAQSANMNFSENITRKSISALISLVEDKKSLSLVKDQGNEFNQLIKVSLALESMTNDTQKAYISKILLTLLENYLFQGKDINNFNADKLIAAARAVMKTDDALNKPVLSSVLQNTTSLYSLNNNPWMQKLFNFVTKETFDYDYFDTFARNITFFDELDKNLKASVNQNKDYLSTTFDIILNKPEQGTTRTNETKLKLDLETFVQMSKVAKGSDFDITKPENIKKIKAATEVSSVLQDKSMSPQNAQTISNLIIDIVVADVLSEKQFAEIVEYTDTIFAFEFSEAKVFNILMKVLRPGFTTGSNYGIENIKEKGKELQEIVDRKITKLNVWVEAVKNELNKDTITQEELEAYIWTLNVNSESYQGGTVGSIVSAVVLNKKTYIVDHNITQNSGRYVWKSVHDNADKTTTLHKIAEFTGLDSGGKHISSQFAGENGHIYWTQLKIAGVSNDGPDKQILFEWDPDDPNKIIQWTINGEVKTTGTTTGTRIRSLFIIDNKVFFSLTGIEGGELVTTTNKISDDNDESSFKFNVKTIKPDIVDQEFKTSWAAGGFSKTIKNKNETFIISPLKNGENLKVVVWSPDNNKTLEFPTIEDFSGDVTSVVIGNYDEETKQQTFFVVGKNGILIKFVVQIANKNGDIDLKTIGKPISLIYTKGQNGETRGATYIDGNITIYAAQKVAYIKDQTSNLNDIFKNLLNE